jgi:hypothetical protein
VTTAARLDALPNVPTVSESVPGYEASALAGVGAPRNAPQHVIAVINREINAALADPGMRTRLADLGGTPIPGSPQDYGRLLAAEIDKWASVIRAANIKLVDHHSGKAVSLSGIDLMRDERWFAAGTKNRRGLPPHVGSHPTCARKNRSRASPGSARNNEVCISRLQQVAE